MTVSYRGLVSCIKRNHDMSVLYTSTKHHQGITHDAKIKKNCNTKHPNVADITDNENTQETKLFKLNKINYILSFWESHHTVFLPVFTSKTINECNKPHEAVVYSEFRTANGRC